MLVLVDTDCVRHVGVWIEKELVLWDSVRRCSGVCTE